jgi:hypothetical protein
MDKGLSKQHSTIESVHLEYTVMDKSYIKILKYNDDSKVVKVFKKTKNDLYEFEVIDKKTVIYDAKNVMYLVDSTTEGINWKKVIIQEESPRKYDYYLGA